MYDMNKRVGEHNLIYVLFLYLDIYKIKICFAEKTYSQPFFVSLLKTILLLAYKIKVSPSKKCLNVGFMSFGWQDPIAIKLRFGKVSFRKTLPLFLKN